MDPSEMALLRRLLLGTDLERLREKREDIERMLIFEKSLRDRQGKRDLVADVLSEAMLLRENRDEGVTRAMEPTIAKAIKSSVKRDPTPLVEAVSPVIGPAIRRSVNDAIASMLERFDTLLQHNLSWRAVQWRFESLKSGRPYAEVVLLRTLIYRVDQVFLIHRESGLLLQHSAAALAEVKDPELIGSMLTAIRDFVSDSFSVSEESPVQTMQVGDYKVMVEQGRLAILAAVVRGNPPTELARLLRTVLDNIELEYREELERFDGDSISLEGTRGQLDDCLKSQQQPTAARRPWITPAILGLVVLTALGYWGFQNVRSHAIGTEALNALSNEPGIVITNATSDGRVYRVRGLLDPLARDPALVVGREASAVFDWEWDWQSFLSVEHEIVLQRATQALLPPPSVEISLKGSVLRLAGEASPTWMEGMRGTVAGIAGVTAFLDDELVIVDPLQKIERIWNDALSRLRTEPGILVTDAVRDGVVVSVYGLRDPLARDPLGVIGAEAEANLQWQWHWRPFVSADSELVLARAKLVLRPPETVSLTLDDGELMVAGKASSSWIDAMRRSAMLIPGISGYRDDALEAVDEEGRLRDLLALHVRELAATALFFDVNRVELNAAQVEQLDALASRLRDLASVADEIGLTPRFQVTGYADATGSRSENRRLSLARARSVIEGLVSRGVGEQHFLPVRMGVGPPGDSEDTPHVRAQNRRVTTDVVLLPNPDGSATGTPQRLSH